jgi:hypothetical protein
MDIIEDGGYNLDVNRDSVMGSTFQTQIAKDGKIHEATPLNDKKPKSKWRSPKWGKRKKKTTKKNLDIESVNF